MKAKEKKILHGLSWVDEQRIANRSASVGLRQLHRSLEDVF